MQWSIEVAGKSLEPRCRAEVNDVEEDADMIIKEVVSALVEDRCVLCSLRSIGSGASS